MEETKDEIWFLLESNEETMKKYPFSFSLQIGYVLSENTLKVIWKVVNPADSQLYFSIGAHPAFLCPIHGKRLIFQIMKIIGYSLIKTSADVLPNEKSLVRLDYELVLQTHIAKN